MSTNDPVSVPGNGSAPSCDCVTLRNRLAELRDEMKEIAALFGIVPCHDDRPASWTDGCDGSDRLIEMLEPFAPARTVSVKRLREVLRQHWLTSVECHHEAKTDTAHCYCTVWASEERPNVGSAVDAWIDHVLESLDVPRASLPETRDGETPTDTQRLDWWFANGMDDSVCDGSVDLWWATEINGDATTVVTHGTSLRDAIDKAMRGIHDPEQANV